MHRLAGPLLATGSIRTNGGKCGVRRGLTCSLAAPAHTPVLLEEVVSQFSSRRMDVFVDCTIGAGGHADALLNRCDIGRYIGIDKDPDALTEVSDRLGGHGNVELVQSDFGDIRQVMSSLGVGEGEVGGILVDLGVSSMQLDRSERGFSFKRDGPLDMRMSGGWDGASTAADVVNGMSEGELADVFWKFGEERMSRQIAAEIVRVRNEEGAILTTGALTRAVERVKRRGRSRIHAATLVFQALRIVVNGEMRALQCVLADGVHLLERGGGRMCVISFHSLEDRMVKRAFRAMGCVDGGVGVLTKKAVQAGATECARNRRSRSARLRAVQRLLAEESSWTKKVGKY